MDRASNPATNATAVTLAETRFLRLVQEGPWTYVQRPNATGAIAICAVTDAHEMILVEQYRIPVHRPVIELPAGLMGDIAESPEEHWQEAAARELEEETGYRAARWRLLTHAVSSAGLSDESVHLVQAEGLQQVGSGGGVESESIIVHRIPRNAVPQWLVEQQQLGKQVDYKVYAALYFLAAART